ncbi:MAG: PEGA domain-containing protein [Myxococcales bacterium]|nr:PEGA domain-containing protein [Myxococcales bacterium]
MRARRWSACAALTWGIALGGRTAAAEEAGPLRVAILPGAASDSVPPAIEASLRESVREGLRAGGAGLIESASTGGLLDDCGELQCLAALRERIGVAYVVRSSFAAIDRDYALHLDLIDTRDGAAVASFDDRCSLCGLAEMRARTEAGAEGLLAPLRVDAPAPSILAVATTPAGAEVTIDGEVIGAAPFERVMTPGRHRLEIRHPGHVGAVQEVSVVDGVRTELRVELTPTPTPKVCRLPGVLALAGGVPLVAGGIGLLAIDGRPRPLGCDPTASACAEFETTWSGAAALVGGAVLTTLGAVALHRLRKSRTGRARR